MKDTVTNGKYEIDNAIDNTMASAINQMVR
jgi:hypothetical protein